MSLSMNDPIRLVLKNQYYIMKQLMRLLSATEINGAPDQDSGKDELAAQMTATAKYLG